MVKTIVSILVCKENNIGKNLASISEEDWKEGAVKIYKISHQGRSELEHQSRAELEHQGHAEIGVSVVQYHHLLRLSVLIWHVGKTWRFHHQFSAVLGNLVACL